MFDSPTHTHHLRRDIDDLRMGFAFTQLLVSQILVRLTEITSISDRGDVEVTQMTGLIVDERDEWGDDEGDAFGDTV
jgi:hypothetical protein